MEKTEAEIKQIILEIKRKDKEKTKIQWYTIKRLIFD